MSRKAIGRDERIIFENSKIKNRNKEKMQKVKSTISQENSGAEKSIARSKDAESFQAATRREARPILFTEMPGSRGTLDAPRYISPLI
jgi:hypothetical protein